MNDPPAAAGPPEEERPFTIDDLMRQDGTPRDWRDLPRLLAASFRLARRAAPRELLWASGLQVFNGVAVAAQLLVGRELLEVLFGPGASLPALLPWLAALVAVGALQRFAAIAEQEQNELLRELVNQHTQSRILGVTAKVDLAEFEGHEFYNRLQRATMGSGMRTMQMVQGLFMLARAVTAAAGGLAVLFVLQPLLIPLLLLTAVPLWLVTKLNSQATFRFFVGMTPLERARQYLAHLLTDRGTAKEVRAFGLAGYLRDKHAGLSAERVRELREMTRKVMLRSLAGAVGSALVVGAAFAALAWLHLSGRLDLPSAGAAVAAMIQLAGTTAQLGVGTAQLYEASLFVRDYEEFLRLGAGREAPAESETLPPFTELRAEGVTFAYPGSAVPALREVDLTVRAGEVTALVGENGSGKTTLAKLLAQLYRPDTGRITWDGHDTARSPQHEQITVIFQDFVQYHLTARENIALGRHRQAADDEAVRQAAHQADAGFLEKLRDGYETMLGREFMGGVDLSIGQWQRVALARAFFRQAPFIVLDEPTAALDARAEHELFVRIKELFAGRTVLLISHRFSTVRSADHIYVLHEGRIVEHGGHAELMALGGRYAELFTLQAASYT
ncbi:ABC transporter ATP-binding protein [Nonomuraea sp. NPDC050328]|uniref:ABC transporter ATP-binding protein n=1 Tax=Nonomuraea sp. NPDC050328 TaxID=3364361 RepID=UPI0037B97787